MWVWKPAYSNFSPHCQAFNCPFAHGFFSPFSVLSHISKPLLCCLTLSIPLFPSLFLHLCVCLPQFLPLAFLFLSLLNPRVTHSNDVPCCPLRMPAEQHQHRGWTPLSRDGLQSHSWGSWVHTFHWAFIYRFGLPVYACIHAWCKNCSAYNWLN